MLKHMYDEETKEHVIYDSEDLHEVRRFGAEDYNEGMDFYFKNKMLNTKFHKLEQLIEEVNAEMRRLSVEAEQEGEELDQLGWMEFPHEIRWKLHVAACSVRDYTFWVYKCTDDGTYYRAYEVESGTHHDGVTPREALELHFKQADVMDLPRRSS